MRYINLDDLVLPVGWDDKAKKAAKAVKGGSRVDKFEDVWRELKPHLSDLLHGKCWYCESPVTRSDNAVDHYRPKGRCMDASLPHIGYHWLAFEKENYRYSCTFCNSRRKDIAGGTAGGKADRFPLFDENDRVYSPGSHEAERPKLLDPCEFEDWELLGCRREDGTPCSATSDPVGKAKVEASIEIYHLDLEATCKLRHPFAVRLISEVEQAKRFFLKIKKDDEMKREWNVSARRIKAMISKTSPFSGEMLFLLKGQRQLDHPWIQKLIDA